MRAGAEVGRQEHPIVKRRQALGAGAIALMEEVDRGAEVGPSLQGALQVARGDEFSAGRVDEHRSLGKAHQALIGQHATRGGRERHVQGEIVTLPAEIVHFAQAHAEITGP